MKLKISADRSFILFNVINQVKVALSGKRLIIDWKCIHEEVFIKKYEDQEGDYFKTIKLCKDLKNNLKQKKHRKVKDSNPLLKKVFRDIEKKFNVFIVIQYETQKIRYHGDPEISKSIELELQTFIDQFQSINLSYEGYSLRELLANGTKLLKDLTQQYELLNIRPVFNNKTIEIKGKKEPTEKVKNILLEILEKSKIDIKRINIEGCTICFSDIIEPYTLQGCGHTFCSACLRELIIQSSYDINLLPVKCASCNESIIISDIVNLIEEADKKKLFLLSINKFLNLNINRFISCMTPDCPEIFSIKTKTINCNVCRQEYCTLCKEEGHIGMSCKIYNKYKTGDLLFKLYLNENDVRPCPECKINIEKNEGCQHMSCIQCQKHICWVCMAIFETSQETYAHLTDTHGGYHG